MIWSTHVRAASVRGRFFSSLVAIMATETVGRPSGLGAREVVCIAPSLAHRSFYVAREPAKKRFAAVKLFSSGSIY